LAIAPGLTVIEVLTYWFRHDARLNLDLLNELARFRDAGLRVYLATNQEHLRAHYLMDTLDLSAHVDGCYYSAAIGHRKTAFDFFAIVASKVALPPSELLLIDDAEENVRAALQVGWHAARWTGRERLNDLIARVTAATTN
jgi:putative hydrolase of the HAD superfamily